MRYPQRKPTKNWGFSLVISAVLEFFVLLPGKLEAVTGITSRIAVSGAAGATGGWLGFWRGTG